MAELNRDNRAFLAQETLRLLQEGTYLSPSGRRVDLAAMQTAAVQASRLYRPEDFPNALNPAPAHAAPPDDTARLHFEVTPETTLQAARRLAAANPAEDVLCLNFAAARNPGGGFLGGSQAQEDRKF